MAGHHVECIEEKQRRLSQNLEESDSVSDLILKMIMMSSTITKGN